MAVTFHKFDWIKCWVSIKKKKWISQVILKLQPLFHWLETCIKIGLYKEGFPQVNVQESQKKSLKEKQLKGKGLYREHRYRKISL